MEVVVPQAGRYLDGKKRINSDRIRNFEENSRDYSVSVISNILELSDVISFKTFEKIDKIRRVRNRIVHQDEKKPCEAKDCQIAFDIIKEFIKQEVKIDLELNLGRTISGL